MSRVLVATGIFPPDIGGPATYSKLLLEELPKRGHTVRVLSFGATRPWPKGIRHVVYAWHLWRQSKNCDVIFAQDAISVGIASALIAMFRRKNFFIRVAGDYAWEQGRQRFGVTDDIDTFQGRWQGWRVALLRWLQSKVVCSADQVITPSHYFRKLVAGWGVPEEKIVAIYNGIRSAAEAVTTVPWASRPRVIFSVGRLVPWKGFDGLIRLMASLPEWELEIAGEGPDRGRLEQEIERVGVVSRVRLLGGLPRDQMLKRLSQVKVFVLNTSFESFSFQTVEAMQVGTPVIITAIGSLPELVSDGREGFLVKPDDLPTISARIKWVENHPEDTEELIKNAQQKSRQFSIQTTVDQVAALLNQKKT